MAAAGYLAQGGRAASIETGTKLYISNLDYGVSNDDIKVIIISLFFLYFVFVFYLAWPWIFTLNFSMRHGGDIWEFVRNPCFVLFVASVCIVWERSLILFYLQTKKVLEQIMWGMQQVIVMWTLKCMFVQVSLWFCVCWVLGIINSFFLHLVPPILAHTQHILHLVLPILAHTQHRIKDLKPATPFSFVHHLNKYIATIIEQFIPINLYNKLWLID